MTSRPTLDQTKVTTGCPHCDRGVLRYFEFYTVRGQWLHDSAEGPIRCTRAGE